MDQQLLCQYWEFSIQGMFSSECLLYLLQVIELHGYLSEEEVDVRTPLHSTDKIRLYIVRERKSEWDRRKCIGEVCGEKGFNEI